MTVIKAFWNALGSAISAPRLIALLWLTLLLSAAPFGLAMQRAIAHDIGASRVHVDLRERMDMVWLGEFRERAGDLGRTFDVTTSSRVDFLHNLDLLFSGRLFTGHPGLVSAGVGYVLIWLLLLGGIIDRFARGGGRFVLSQFLGAGGRYFSRLLVLTGLSALGYWAIYRAAAWGYEALEEATRDITVEGTVLKYYLLGALPVLLAAAAVMMIFDFARVAAVVEERGAWSALGRGARFVVGQPFKVLGLVLLVSSITVGVVALRTIVLPSVGESDALGVLLVFVVGQLFVVSRLLFRVARVGAQLTLYKQARR